MVFSRKHEHFTLMERHVLGKVEKMPEHFSKKIQKFLQKSRNWYAQARNKFATKERYGIMIE